MSITISNKHEDMDVDMIHQYLSEVGYWSPGISRDQVARAMKGSLPFGLFHRGRQVAYARVISDYVSFAHLGDVFVIPDYQGKGLGKQLMTAIHEHPQLQGLRGWTLKTKDAHDLYCQHGWEVDPTPEWSMVFNSGKQI